MPKTTTVWAVRTGVPQEVRCSMRLEGSDIVLTSEGAEERIPLSGVRRVRRVLGSPVLVLRLEGETLPARVILYFAQPPPLPQDQAMSRRRARRRNLTYLGTRNVEGKHQIRDWAAAIRAAAGLGRTPD